MNRKGFKKDVLDLREMMLHRALRLLGSTEDAEDVVQEIFLKLWSNKQLLAEVDNKEAYLMSMTKNLCLDKLKLKKKNEDVALLLVEKARSLEKELDDKEQLNIVAWIIEGLPELQKMIVKMHDIEDYTTKEIAKNIGAKEEAVRMNLSRARKSIRTIYNKIIHS